MRSRFTRRLELSELITRFRKNGVQALSPTHGMNIVVGYFTRQQPHDYEFAMHRSIGGNS
jgi:hypothetical protein